MSVVFWINEFSIFLIFFFVSMLWDKKKEYAFIFLMLFILYGLTTNVLFFIIGLIAYLIILIGGDRYE